MFEYPLKDGDRCFRKWNPAQGCWMVSSSPIPGGALARWGDMRNYAWLPLTAAELAVPTLTPPEEI